MIFKNRVLDIVEKIVYVLLCLGFIMRIFVMYNDFSFIKSVIESITYMNGLFFILLLIEYFGSFITGEYLRFIAFNFLVGILSFLSATLFMGFMVYFVVMLYTLVPWFLVSLILRLFFKANKYAWNKGDKE